jgi:AcrR family transcriptional regulator
MTDVKPRRAYRSQLRDEAAMLGQKAVVEAAAALFTEQGYARTTMDQIAALAGVSRPTVFAVGSKAQLLALARRTAIGGDSVLGNEPILTELLAESDPAALLRRFAALASGIARRWAPLHAALEEGAASDPALAPLRQTSRDEMYGCARHVVAALRSSGSLRGDLTAKAAADVLSLLLEPGQYQRLVTERHWSHRAFTEWHADAMIRLLLP